MLYKIICAL